MMKATKQSQQRCCPFVCERSSAWLAALSRRETCASLEAPSSMRCVTRTVFAREQDQIAWKSWVSSTQKRSRGLKPLGSETRTKAKYSSCCSSRVHALWCTSVILAERLPRHAVRREACSRLARACLRWNAAAFFLSSVVRLSVAVCEKTGAEVVLTRQRRTCRRGSRRAW